MRALFGVVGLLFVVVIVGMLAKKQLASVPAPAVPGAAPGSTAQPVTPKQQVEQFKQSVDAVVLQPRAMPDEEKK